MVLYPLCFVLRYILLHFIHSSCSSAVNRCQWLSSNYGPFTPLERVYGAHWGRSSVGPRTKI